MKLLKTLLSHKLSLGLLIPAALGLFLLEPAYANFAAPITDKMAEAETEGLEILKWACRISLAICIGLLLKTNIPWNRIMFVAIPCILVGEWDTIIGFFGL